MEEREGGQKVERQEEGGREGREEDNGGGGWTGLVLKERSGWRDRWEAGEENPQPSTLNPQTLKSLILNPQPLNPNPKTQTLNLKH